MHIQKAKHRTDIHISKDEIIALVAKNFLKNQKQYVAHIKNLPAKMVFSFIHFKITKDEIETRKESLQKAAITDFLDFVKEFKKTTTPQTKKVISQFYNACESVYSFRDLKSKKTTLEYIISGTKEDFSRFRGIGQGGLDLFETFLASKGHRFAQWNGKENV